MEQPAIEDGTESAPAVDASEESWHPLKKLLFRFSCIYFLWYAVPNVFELAFRSNPFDVALHRLAIQVGESVLGMDYAFAVDSTSGDSMAHYLALLVMVVVSLAGSLVWTLVDRERRHYRRLGGWLVVALRYYLVSVMIAYGLAKIFTVQFAPPSLERLLQTYGSSSPMGLHTTAMGFSKTYTAFGGVAELIGGLLLCMRRTTTLGAAILVGVMTNVVVMNFSYDVSVKLYSSHVLLAAVVLLALDGRRLLNLFVFNRPAPVRIYLPHFTSQRARITGRAVKVAAIGLFLLLNISQGIASERALGPNAAKPQLYGIHDVETFSLDGETLPPLLTDDRRWRNVIFDTNSRFSVRKMDGTFERYDAVVDGPGKLSIYLERGVRKRWSYERLSPEIVQLAGELDDRVISLVMKARNLDEIRLINREFHWVSEVPFYH